jgi:ring-1,2-phenylacetyl-CoA epoxidase subunit PaaC
VVRLLVFAAWRLPLLDRLTASRDPVLAAIGAKGVKEVTYHREYAAGWVVRLGDGTKLSHARMREAVQEILPTAAELFRPHDVELRAAAAGIGVDPSAVRSEFDDVLRQVLDAGTLGELIEGRPANPDAGGGRDGSHGPELTEVLTEMQSVARELPGGVW